MEQARSLPEGTSSGTVCIDEGAMHAESDTAATPTTDSALSPTGPTADTGATTTPAGRDADGDGVPTPADCDDDDPLTYPGAPQRLLHDADCDGFVESDITLAEETARRSRSLATSTRSTCFHLRR